MTKKARTVSLVSFLLFAFLGVAILRPNSLEVLVLLWSIAVLLLFFFSRFGTPRNSTQGLTRLRYRPTGPSALEEALTEARKTLQIQVDNLNDLDTKAVRILRVNVLLTGIILSALTFSAKAETVSFDGFLNVYFGVGILLLIASTAAAGLTYTASDFRVGMSRRDLEMTLDEDLTTHELHLALTKSYAKWIHQNQSTEVLNSFYSTSTILLLIYAVTYLALGVYDALVRQVPILLEGASNVALLVITLASGYLSQIKRVLRELKLRIEPFD